MIFRKKFHIFKKNRRAYISLLLFLLIFVVSLFSELISNDKPLIIKYNNDYYFPIFNEYPDTLWGGDFPSATNYHDPIIQKNITQKGWMLFPIIPYSFNTVDYYLKKQHLLHLI